MASFRTYQRIGTVSRSAAGSIVQASASYLDLADANSVAVRVEVFAIDAGVTLSLQTSTSLESPFVTLESWTAAVDETLQLRRHYTAQYPLQRWVRWVVTTTGAGAVCMRMRYRQDA